MSSPQDKIPTQHMLPPNPFPGTLFLILSWGVQTAMCPISHGFVTQCKQALRYTNRHYYVLMQALKYTDRASNFKLSHHLLSWAAPALASLSASSLPSTPTWPLTWLNLTLNPGSDRISPSNTRSSSLFITAEIRYKLDYWYITVVEGELKYWQIRQSYAFGYRRLRRYIFTAYLLFRVKKSVYWHV